MVKVSVIIPVFNTEKYLNECLDSVINQTLNDIEIICINDGSTDDSLNILESYSTKDKRLKIISQPNKGQGAARNVGLKMSKGEYIYFMDSDDILKSETLKENYDLCQEKNLDLSMFQLINYDDEKNEYYQDHHYNMPTLAESVKDEIFSYKDLGETIFHIAVSPVNKLYNKQFLTNLNVKFPEDVLFEDNIFFWNVFLNANRILFIQKHYYIRRRHSSSSTGTAGIRFLDTIEVHNRVFDIFKGKKIFNKFKCNLFNKKINLVYLRFKQVNSNIKPLFFDKMKKDFQTMLNEYGEELFSCLNNNQKLILNNTIKAKGYEELILLVENEKLELSNKKWNYKNKKIIKNIKNTKNENHSILNSNSWKITKPLRFIKKFIK